MRNGGLAIAYALAAAVGLTPPPLVQAAEADAQPLAAFDRLVGGRWYFGDTYQVFEWGVGKRALRATAYFPSPEGPKLTSEGLWYFHPESDEIRGIFVSIEMGLDLFEYVTTFEGDTMTSRLSVHGPKGREEYIETLEFTDADHYVWSLWRDTTDGRDKVMEGSYERRPAEMAAEERR